MCGRSEVRVGTLGEVCVCGGEPGCRGQRRSGGLAARRCGAERRTWKREVACGGFPARVGPRLSRRHTDARRRDPTERSALTMFDVGRLAESLSDTSGIPLCPTPLLGPVPLHMEPVVSRTSFRSQTSPFGLFID